MNDILIKSICDFLEHKNLQEEVLEYVATCDRAELKEIFDR